MERSSRTPPPGGQPPLSLTVRQHHPQPLPAHRAGSGHAGHALRRLADLRPQLGGMGLLCAGVRVFRHGSVSGLSLYAYLPAGS